MRVLVRNPNSGNRSDSRRAAEIAEKRGFTVRDSNARGETRTIAREVAPDADLVAACGGDGTLNEVVSGVDDAGALDSTELGVVPAGTGNNFARNVGVPDIKTAFDVLDDGDCRSLDLGMADDRIFVNSCVGGLTAESSSKTTPERKRQLGVLAYVLQTLAETRRFEGLQLDVRADDGETVVYQGEAVMLLVGNGRRFPGESFRQADVEDGLLNVVIIERRPAIDYVAAAAADRLLRRDADHLTRVRVPHLQVTHEGDPVQFSLDGEMLTEDDIDLRCRPGAVRFRVGETYRPHPPAQ